MMESHEVNMGEFSMQVMELASLQEIGVTHLVSVYEWDHNRQCQNWDQIRNFVPTWNWKNNMVVTKPLLPLRKYKMGENR